MTTSPSPQTSKCQAASPERSVIEQVQQQVKAKYLGRYGVLLRRLPASWDKSKLSRVLSSKNPRTLEFLAVASAAGIALGPLLQHITT